MEKRIKNTFKIFLERKKTFWSDGYYVSSIGNASEETIKKYIEQQGWAIHGLS